MEEQLKTSTAKRREMDKEFLHSSSSSHSSVYPAQFSEKAAAAAAKIRSSIVGELLDSRYYSQESGHCNRFENIWSISQVTIISCC
jgi:hypothetical protein